MSFRVIVTKITHVKIFSFFLFISPLQENTALQISPLYLCEYTENITYPNLSLSLSLLALQPPSGVVFYSPLLGFSLLAYEVS